MITKEGVTVRTPDEVREKLHKMLDAAIEKYPPPHLIVDDVYRVTLIVTANGPWRATVKRR